MSQAEARHTEQVFLSYSRTDREACISLRSALEQSGFSVFRDEDAIRVGDRWMTRLEEALQGCSAFVLLVGRDGVQRWVGAEVQVVLIRHLSPHDDAQRLPISATWALTCAYCPALSQRLRCAQGHRRGDIRSAGFTLESLHSSPGASCDGIPSTRQPNGGMLGSYSERFTMKQPVVYGLIGLVLVGLGASSAAFGEGASNGRERFFLKRQNCAWTDEMGKYIYECIKKNDGFNAHWCHNEAIDAFCPADESAIPHPTDVPPSGKPAEPAPGKKS